MTDHQDAMSTTTDTQEDAMSDQTTIETPAAEAQEPDQLEPETPETGQETDPRQRASEAAKYRVRAREAEAQVSTLTERVAALQTAEVDRVLADAGYKPKGFWATGAQLADFTTDTGTIDAGKVEQAAQAAALEYGLQHTPDPRAASSPLEGMTPEPHKPRGMAGAFSPNW